MNNYTDFLKDDVETGLLKARRVGMIRRTLKWIDGRRIEEFVFFPMIKNFVVLNVRSLFKIRELNVNYQPLK